MFKKIIQMKFSVLFIFCTPTARMTHDITSNERVVPEVLMILCEAENRRLCSLLPVSTGVGPDGLNGSSDSDGTIDNGGEALSEVIPSFVSADYGGRIRVEVENSQQLPDSDTELAKFVKTTIDRRWQGLDRTTTDE
jgi:hypothetical protein